MGCCGCPQQPDFYGYASDCDCNTNRKESARHGFLNSSLRFRQIKRIMSLSPDSEDIAYGQSIYERE